MIKGELVKMRILLAVNACPNTTWEGCQYAFDWDTVNGQEFATQIGVTCKMISYTFDMMQAKANFELSLLLRKPRRDMSLLPMKQYSFSTDYVVLASQYEVPRNRYYLIP